MYKNQKNNNGITLIALIVTIIIMLILAGVTISVFTGENSFIEKIKESSFKSKVAALNEELQMYIFDIQMENIGEKSGDGLIANEDTLILNGEVQNEKTIKDVLTGATNDDINEFSIVNGELKYLGNDEQKATWFANVMYKKSNIQVETISSENNVRLEKTTGDSLQNYKIYGNARSGKNLLNLDTASFVHCIKNNDGSITSNIRNVYFSSIGVDALNEFLMNNLGETFTFSTGLSISSKSTSIVIYGTRTGGATYQEAGEANTGKVSITVANDFTAITSIELRFNRALTPFTDTTTTIPYVQFERGAIATEYEPYGAMPSPDYPSEIQSLGDLVTEGEHAGKYKVPVVVRGKNALDSDTALIENGFVKQDDGSFYVADCNNVLGKVFFVNNGNHDVITISYDYKYTTDVATNACCPKVYYKDGWYEYVNNVAEIEPVYRHTSFTSNQAKVVDYVTWTYYNGRPTYIKNIQIEQGTTETSYEPYNAITTNIYLDKPLYKIGDVADYIDYANSRIVRNVGEYVFTGDETVRKRTDIPGEQTNAYIINLADVLAKDMQPVLCNYFECDNSLDDYEHTRYSRDQGGYRFHFFVNKSRCATYEDFQNWLETKSTNGAPVKVLYQLATPKEEYINLPSIPTLEGETIIEVSDGSIGASKIEATYIKNQE